MSLEESMLKLAESNLTLANAQNAHTAGLLKYIEFQKSGGTGPAATTTTAADTAAAEPVVEKKTRAKKETAAAPAAEVEVEADPFADEEAAPEEVELTAEVIRALVMKVKDVNKDHALALLKKVGAETVSKIDPKAYPKVVELAAKVGVTL